MKKSILEFESIKITPKGFAKVVRHLSRFEYDKWNYGMLERMIQIILGAIEPTEWDRAFYSHELREYVWYRFNGWEYGQPEDDNESYNLWRILHDRTIEEYGIDFDNQRNLLYHPNVRMKYPDR